MALMIGLSVAMSSCSKEERDAKLLIGTWDAEYYEDEDGREPYKKGEYALKFTDNTITIYEDGEINSIAYSLDDGIISYGFGIRLKIAELTKTSLILEDWEEGYEGTSRTKFVRRK